MSSSGLVKLDPRTPENRSVKCSTPLKLFGENVLWIIRFRSNFVEFKRMTPELL